MSDYLTTLAQRTFELLPLVSPVLPSVYEAVAEEPDGRLIQAPLNADDDAPAPPHAAEIFHQKTDQGQSMPVTDSAFTISTLADDALETFTATERQRQTSTPAEVAPQDRVSSQRSYVVADQQRDESSNNRSVDDHSDRENQLGTSTRTEVAPREQERDKPSTMHSADDRSHDVSQPKAGNRADVLPQENEPSTLLSANLSNETSPIRQVSRRPSAVQPFVTPVDDRERLKSREAVPTSSIAQGMPVADQERATAPDRPLHPNTERNQNIEQTHAPSTHGRSIQASDHIESTRTGDAVSPDVSNEQSNRDQIEATIIDGDRHVERTTSEYRHGIESEATSFRTVARSQTAQKNEAADEHRPWPVAVATDTKAHSYEPLVGDSKRPTNSIEWASMLPATEQPIEPAPSVSIGRVEVRPAPPVERVVPNPSDAKPPVPTLKDYLAQRQDGWHE